MINSACLDGDGENGQSIASGGCFLGCSVAIRPVDCSNCRRAIYPDRIASNGLCEFAIDIDNAIWTISWRGVGCPTTAIIWSQRRRRRGFELTEHDGERGNRCARNSLCGVAAARYHNHCQQ